MGLLDRVGEMLSAPSKKEVEELRKRVELAEELLKNARPPESYPSSMARESKLIEDVQSSVQKRVSVRGLQKLYLFNQFIFRGVNVRADELISRGFEIVGDDEEGVKLCQKLVEDSGGANLFWQLSVNTDVSGDGYMEKIWSKDGKTLLLLRHINPVNFGFWTDPTKGNIILGKNGYPEAYMQIYYDEEAKERRVKIPKEKIAHLIFNSFADEFNGISSIQPVYNTAIRLMNMEHAAAEAAVKAANPIWVGTTKTKNPTELAKWSGILNNISGKDQVFLPEGVELEMKAPGNQNFNEYADYFLDAVVAALGVPKSILTGSADASGGNRGTAQVQSKHFYSVIRSNQRYVEKLFNDLFKEYAGKAGFTAPTLHFDDITDDATTYSKMAIELYTTGLITLQEARELVGYDADEATVKELKSLQPMPRLYGKFDNWKSGMDPDAPQKKEDAKFWHGGDGSQAGNKAKQKMDPNVPSVN